MNQFTTTLAVFAALFAGSALAHSGHHVGIDKRIGDINGTITTNASLVDDHIPVMNADPCVCATPICDSRMSASSICGCQQAALLACYNANPNCAKPADNVCNSPGST